MKYTILVAEDEKSLQKHLKKLLSTHGYLVKIVSDESALFTAIRTNYPDVIMLDLALPETNETLCQEIKKSVHETPIIIFTNKDEVDNASSERGFTADDYLIKPFIDDELVTRLKIRLHKQETTDTVLQIADLTLHAQTLEVKRKNKRIHLTPQEFKLLHYLMSNKGKIVTRDMILSRIWMYSSDIETRVVDVYIGYLRKKIDGGFEKKLLHSIRGFGYVIKE